MLQHKRHIVIINDIFTTESPFNETLEITGLSEESPSPYQVGIIFIGAIGLAGNGLVLSTLLSREARKRTMNLLITNQLTLDMFSSLMLILSHVIQLTESDILSGPWGTINCILFTSDTIPFFSQVGSIPSLVFITLERYFKIVHPILHRKYFKKWMIGVAVVISWLNGVLINIAVFWTSGVVDGICYSFWFWPSPVLQTSYSIFVIVWEYFIPLILFIYLYGHILIIIRRRRNKLFQTQQNQSNKTKNSASRSIIVTLILVSVAFAICWAPNQIYFLLIVMVHINLGDTFYYSTLVLVYLNVCINPFLYAVKHDAVKQGIRNLFSKRINSRVNVINFDFP